MHIKNIKIKKYKEKQDHYTMNAESAFLQLKKSKKQYYLHIHPKPVSKKSALCVSVYRHNK